MWEIVDKDTDSRATEIPGLGVLVGVPGIGLTFVPGARLRPTNAAEPAPKFVITRDDRTNAPLVTGKKLGEIKGIPDPGAQAYLVLEGEEPEY